VPFSLLPESPNRMPLLAYAWLAAAVLHLLLWAGKLLTEAANFLLSALIGPGLSQPLPLWSAFAGPLYLLTLLVQWRRVALRAPWGHVAAALVWLGLLVSLPRLLPRLVGGTITAALVTVALFVLPLALSLMMMRLVVDGDAESRAA
jgi:hypothetical protein